MKQTLQLAIAALVAATALCASALRAQVIHLSGGASTVADTQGAAVTVYGADSTTQSSLGYSNGIHIGAYREVRSGASSLLVGDTHIALQLPTDLPGDTRTLQVRGALLQRHTEPGRPGSNDALAFAGFTGNSYSNAFASSIAPTHFIAVAAAHHALTSIVDLSTVTVKGTHNSALASAAFQLNPHTSAAVTTGISGNHGIVRTSFQSRGNTWSAQANYTSGALHLQPEPSLSTLTLERIGWNLSATRTVGNWLALDAARHEYATADIPDAPSQGVTAGRSTLYEGGTTIRVAHIEAGTRLLHSVSGSQTSGGIVFLAGWNTTRGNIRATNVHTAAADGSRSTSTSIDTTENVTQRLHLTQGATFSNSSPSFDFGGNYENRWGAITVSHQETFIPFGTQSGFHRVLALGIRLHLPNAELTASQITAAGVTPVYSVAIDSFHGDSVGPAAFAPSHMASIPRFTIEGNVTTPDGKPIRGAAVETGAQTIYTDSEGHFLARFATDKPVRIAIAPEAFLTAETYHPITAPKTVQPTRQAAAALDLQAERSLTYNDTYNTHENTCAETCTGDSAPAKNLQNSTLQRTKATLVGLLRRLVLRHA